MFVMRVKIRKVTVLITALLVYGASVHVMAQQIKLVSGRVLDKMKSEEMKKPVPFVDAMVQVFAFNTVAEAEDMMKILGSDNINTNIEVNYVFTDNDGYYDLSVAETGALIIKVEGAPPVLEKINHRLELLTYVDVGHMLDEVSIVGIRTDIAPEPKAPTIVGNKMILQGNVSLPAQFGKTNARLIIQPYVIHCDSPDTVSFTVPMIYDGEQYHLTQERKMGYDLSNDPLIKYVDPNTFLTEGKKEITWEDTVRIPNPNKNYQAFAAVQLEDFTQIYYSKSIKIATCETKRPLKFLEYSLDQYDLDPEKYRERPKREQRSATQNISLNFLVGKAELDPADPNNEIQLNALREKLLEVVNGEGSTLKQVNITGVASPEGSYNSNLTLAQKRLSYAQGQILSVIPAYTMKRVLSTTRNVVATWSEVADLLEKDSLNTEADEIREIVEKFPKSMDQQFARIIKLPYYASLIKERLPKLRTVRCEYKSEVYRELTPEEIMDRYENDSDYRSGKKSFELYEYWALFKMVKDSRELETLYRRAYDDSKKLRDQPWILAANNLAVSYLRRDTVDTSILEPLIDRSTRGTNVSRKLMNGNSIVINTEEVVANQLAMYLKADNFDQGSVMAQILPNTDKNRKLKAFAMCLGGYYKGGTNAEERARSREVFELVKNSSLLNEVVMWLALDSKGGNMEAEKAVDKLSLEEPITWYLKAIISLRKGETGLQDASNCMIQCFKRDEKYMQIAENDGDVGKENFDFIMDMYQLEKEMMEMNGVGGGF